MNDAQSNFFYLTTAATCKNSGMRYDICTTCNEQFNSKLLSSTELFHGERTLVKASVCAETLTELQKCPVCKTEELGVPPLRHRSKYLDEVAAAILKTGRIKRELKLFIGFNK